MATLYDVVQLHDAKRQIRLLDLYPGNLDDEICGSLRVADLVDAPEYEALSYTWGEASMNRTVCITVREASFQIPFTDNLFAALRRLRDPASMVTLWVDAVCIDQSSTSDKGDQVKMMGNIYSHAATTFVWLGELDNSPVHADGDDDNLWFMTDLIDHLVKDHTRQQWHQRAWVLQEFIRSRRRVLCIEDRRMAVDDTVQNWAGIWYNAGPLHLAIDDAYAGFWCFLHAALDTYDRVDQSDLSLLRLSCQTAHMRARDPKDKIYSLLGLVDAQQSINVGLDYDLALEEVFSAATFASVRHEGVHALLAVNVDLNHTGRRSSLPTWCIEFDRLKVTSRPGQSDVPEWLDHMTGQLIPAQSNGFSPTRIRLCDNNRLLIVHASPIGPVKLVVGSIEDEMFRKVPQAALPLLYAELYDDPAARRPRPKRDDEIGDPTSSFERFKEFIRRSVFNAWDRLITDADSRLRYGEQLGIDAVSDVDIKSRGTSKQLESFHSYLDDRFVWIFLNSGHIGLAPNGIASGDVLVAVQGCILPLILRRLNEHWTFHGLAWVHAFDMATFTSQMNTETFTIC